MDKILRMTLEGGAARAMVALTTDLAESARQTHGLSALGCAVLGRTLTAGAMLGVNMKNTGDSLTLTLRGGGPIGPVVCVAHADGTVKGYVGQPDLELPLRADGKLDVGGAVGQDGRLTVVRDLGLRDPYVGQTRLVSGEIAEDLAFYLTVSEQTPSLVALGVMVKSGHVQGAGGVLVQPMPDCPEEVLTRLEGLSEGLVAVSGMAQACSSAEELAARALAGVSYEILDSANPVFACDCSRERIERALLSMGEAEIRDMIEKQHGAQVGCQFCEKTYEFTQEDLLALLREGKGEGEEA